MKSIFFTAILATFVFLSITKGTMVEVPADYSTIQEAINAVSDGDTVLVAPGTYYENINFLGKNIFVTSFFMYDEDVSYILNTIIDGSQPAHPDTASCVRIVSGEDSTAVLQGFTLTGGTGTKWTDEHGAGTYVEGGGILMTFSSPTIKNNLIINNEAIRTGTGITSAGGGGIRVGDGIPHIINNVIMSNSGMYGGGIVLNYTGAVIKNNIIYNNRVYQAVSGAPTFGGGGIWTTGDFGNEKKIIDNNTIVGNASSGTGSTAARKGGGILIWSTTIEAKNNIIWGNTQTFGGQITQIGGGTSSITFSLIEGGWSGTGNLNSYPQFMTASLYLSDISVCVDAGNPDPAYNDPEDPLNPGIALWPSMGSLTNDIGVYGGPGRSLFPWFYLSKMNVASNLNFGTISPGDTASVSLIISNEGTDLLLLDSLVVRVPVSDVISIADTFPRELLPLNKDTITVSWMPVEEGILSDTIWIYHNAENLFNPLGILVSGEAIITSVSNEGGSIPDKLALSQNYPNPFNPTTKIRFSIPQDERREKQDISLIIYDVLGNEIARLVDEEKPAGEYEVNFDGSSLPSGIYFYQLKTNASIQTRKMMLIK